MEKNMGFGESTLPSAPPPTAPPSYEEAVGFTVCAPHPPANVPPYPVGSSAMPMPVPYSQPPIPPNYAGTSEPTSHSQTQHNAEAPNFVPPQQVRIIPHHVIYALSSNPVKMTCPTCHADIKTSTISDHQPRAHICCIVLCLLGCCLCSCLPYCMSAFVRVHHFCPNCKNYIGTWKG